MRNTWGGWYDFGGLQAVVVGDTRGIGKGCIRCIERMWC